MLKAGVSCVDNTPPVGIGPVGFAARDPFSVMAIDIAFKMSYIQMEGDQHSRVRLPAIEKACCNEAIWLFQYMLVGTKEDIDDIAEAVLKVKENAKELIS